MPINNALILLEEIEKILVQCSVRHWSTIIKERTERLKAAIDSKSVKWIRDELELIKELYGGMGSFNDIYISPEAGDTIRSEDVNTVNGIFKGLQGQLYEEVENEIRGMQNTK